VRYLDRLGTVPKLSHHHLIFTLTSAILLLLKQTRSMFDEIQDMQGEIFDVPNIETVLIEDENGELGVDLTDINN
jgi:hypothetical protein